MFNLRLGINSSIILLCLTILFLQLSEGKYRVENGIPVGYNAAPYIAALLDSYGPYCAGTIISHLVIVTAAHCLTPRKPIQVRIGSQFNHKGGDVYDILDIIWHDKYSSPHEVDAIYDYGIVILKKPVLTKGVHFAKLYSKDLPTGTTLTLSGWGEQTQLEQAKIPIYNMTQCIANYGYIPLTVDPHVMICAGFEAGHTTACRGDSGGPLVYKKRYLVGIVSWGDNDCMVAKFPGVYSRVSTMIDWFNSFGRKHQLKAAKTKVKSGDVK